MTSGVKLALGTAQLGMPYGVANTSGQPDDAEARAIVEAAWRGGVRFFDTAQAYGTSQAVLGRCFRELDIGARVKVISKLDPAIPSSSVAAIRDAVENTLEQLGVPCLWALLLHRESQLDAWEGVLGPCLLDLRDRGLVERLGVSVYGSEAAHRALSMPDMEVLQVPANVFDRRMKRAGVFDRAARRDRRIFVRSVFLQGLALMLPSEVPAEVPFARQAVTAYVEHCREIGVDRRSFALAQVRHMAPEACLVIGAETRQQCVANCRSMGDAIDGGAIDRGHRSWDARWPVDEEALVNPSGWFR